MERDRRSTPEDRTALLARARASRAAAEERMAAAVAMQVYLLRTTRASCEQLARCDQLLAAVHDEVHTYVRLLRALDTPPEETVIQVKAAVGEAVGRHGPTEESLMASVVTWAVDAYYAG